jgi:FkbM family methyltransferase
MPMNRVRPWAARRALRFLPPFLAYRAHHRWLTDLVGCGAPFRERALFGGGWIESTMTSVEDTYFALFGTMNFKGLALARRLVLPGSVLFEIGANIGTETLAFAALVGDRGRVVAVEADPENEALLRERVAANGLAQVEVIGKPVADTNRPMSVVRISGRGGMSFVSDAAADEGMVSVTLDELMERYGAPCFLFMDIEGGEYRALLGAARMLETARPPIFAEISTLWLERSGSSVAAVADLMASHAYSAYDADQRFFPRIARVPAGEVFADWLFLPDERVGEVPALRRLLFRARVLPRLPLINPLG